MKEEVANPAEGDSWYGEDVDGDSLTNFQELMLGSDPYQIDADHDGLRDDAEQQLSDPTAPFDPWLWDSNSNGFSDHDELYQRLQGYSPQVNYNSLSSAGTPFFSYSDADGDDVKNHEDSDPLNNDRDGDGILNWNDTGYMDDANNGVTLPPENNDPGVYIGGNWYPTGTLDSDGDNTPDHLDPYPFGSFWYNGTEYGGAWSDRDYDNVPDPADSFPDGSFWYNSVEYAGSWIDQDNDQVPDCFDAWPLIAGSFMYNGTEYPGSWSDADNDSIPDAADPFPTVAGSYWWNGVEYGGDWIDADMDGTPDAFDDTPNGGFWFNGTLYAGTWFDTDGDNVPDPADAWPNDSWNGEPRFTYNGTDYPGAWSDRDGDMVPDAADTYPDDPENNADGDGDGLSNYDERTQHGTDPTMQDTDGERLTDYEELMVHHTNPLEQRTNVNQPYTDYYTVDQTDSDNDQIPDRIEQWYGQQGYGMNANDANDALGDLDGDGYTNRQAYFNGWSFIAHLNQYDNDQDRILDVLEDAWSTAYPGILSSGNFNDAVEDFDNDGLMNFEEIALGLNPGSANSRNSSVHDLQEWAWRGIIYQTSVIAFNGTVPAEWNEVLDNDNTRAPDGLESFVAALNANTTGVTLPQRAAGGDYDGDAMPDVWEHRYMLNLRDASDANANIDGDSLTNVQEYTSNPPRDPLINDDPPPPELTLSGGAGNGAVGEAYSATFTASGGTPGYTYSISSGALPDGLSLDSSSGAITGTPSNGGSFDFFVSVNDSAGQTASASFGVTIAGLEIATDALPVATYDAPYTATITAVHGTGPYSFVNVGNDLPFDYSLASNGTLTGTPFGVDSSAVGSYAFTVEVTDSAGRTATKTLTLVIEDAPPPPPLHFVTTQLPNAMAGWNYSSRLIVGGAQGNLTFSITGQPEWMQLAADGTLSGMPPTTGSHTFTVQVQDELYDESLANFRTASATFTLQQTSYQPAVVTIVSGNHQNGVPGQMLPAPLVVRVTLDGAPMVGARVTFGDITLAANANGIASTGWLCPTTEGGFQVPVTSGAGSALFQAWAITPRSGSGPGGTPPVIHVNAIAGVPPAASTQNILADDTEVIVESRFINENGGEVEANYSEHVYKMADQGDTLTMLHEGGGPPFSHTKKNWDTSDGEEGVEPPENVPLMTTLEEWVAGATDGYHFKGKDTEFGYIDGIEALLPPGLGYGSPNVMTLLLQPGTFFEGGWYGRAQGMYQRTTTEVRLRRKTPVPVSPPAGTPPPPEIKRQFLLVTYEKDAIGVETITQTEVKSLTMSPSENESLPLSLAPEAEGPGKSKRLRLLPVEVKEIISDQMAGSECNKLPTAYFGGNPSKPENGHPNNPMLMATRTGQKAKLKVKMGSTDPKVYVGARRVNIQTVLGSASASSAVVDLEFDVPANSHNAYEIVAGYDTNGNFKLDDNEAKVIFEKTPRIDREGNKSTANLQWLDKIIIVDSDQFATSKTETIDYSNFPFTGFAGDLLRAFANGTTSVTGTDGFPPAAQVDASVIPSADGLSHPLGARWASNCRAQTHRLVFTKQSEAAGRAYA